MPSFTPFRLEDRETLDGIYGRVFGQDAVEAWRTRWNWEFGGNPNNPGGVPLILVARDEDVILGQYAAMPVRLSVLGQEIDAAWGLDMLLAPEFQGRLIGKRMAMAFDQMVGSTIGLNLTDASLRLSIALGYSDMGTLPRLTKALSRRAILAAREPGHRRDAALAPFARWLAMRRRHRDVVRGTRFDAGVTRLWERVASRFAFAVRRDAAYLNWKFLDAPLAYSVATVVRRGETTGYVVLRHASEPEWKVTIIVDFLTDPRDPASMRALLLWAEQEAYRAGSDLVRVFSTHREYRKTLRAAGYRDRKASIRLVAHLMHVALPPAYFESTDEWHVTVGDSDADH